LSVSSESSNSSVLSVSSDSSNSSLSSDSSSSDSLSSNSSDSSNSSLSSDSSSSDSESSNSSDSSNSSSSFDVQVLGLSGIQGGDTFQNDGQDRVSIVVASEILLVPSVAADPNFNSEDKWVSFAIVYVHDSGQRKVISHRFRNGQWRGVFRLNTGTNIGTWEKRMIIIADHNGDVFALRRGDVGFDEDVNVEIYVSSSSESSFSSASSESSESSAL
jgi:hypothetical protein